MIFRTDKTALFRMEKNNGTNDFWTMVNFTLLKVILLTIIQMISFRFIFIFASYWHHDWHRRHFSYLGTMDIL